MKFIYTLIFAVALLIFGISLNVAATWLIPSNTEQFNMYLTVGNYTGFNVDTSALFFGTVSPGGWSTRSLSITNHGNATTRVELQPTGNISVTFSTNGFNLEPGENKSVSVTATVPVDMPYGNYTGKLMLLYFG